MVECERPSNFVEKTDNKAKPYQKKSALDDIEWADCIKRHKGLVGEIKAVQILIGLDDDHE